MDKIVYLLYLFLTTTTLVLILRALWSYTMERPVQLRALGLMVVFLSGLVAVYFYVRERQPDALGAARAEFAAAPDAPIKIAAVWPDDDPGFFAGAQRAAQEINASEPSFLSNDGEVVNFTVEIENFPYDATSGPTIGRDVIKDTQVLGVVGHADAVSAIRGSASYHASDLVQFVPSVRQTSLTENPFKSSFQLIADDYFVVGAIADFILANGYKKVAVVAARDDYTHQLYVYFQNALAIKVLGNDQEYEADRIEDPDFVPLATYLTYEGSSLVYRELVTTVSEQSPDFVLIFDEDPGAVDLLLEIMRRRLDLPVVILPQIASFYPSIPQSVLDSIDDAQKELVHVVDLNDSLIRADQADGSFREALVSNYAYDSVILMADMWKRAATLVPHEAATELRALPNWAFAGQTIDFSPRGSLLDPKVDIRALTDFFPNSPPPTNN